MLLLLIIPSLTQAAVTPGEAGGPICYVCDQGYWRKQKGTGECSPNPPTCKNNDSSTFEGCIGGDSKESGVCDEAFLLEERDLLNPSSETDLFTDKERMKAMVPYGESVPDCQGLSALVNDDKCRKFWPSIFLPDGETETLDSAPSPTVSTSPPSGTGGLKETLSGLFKFLNLFVGKAGFLNFPKPPETPFPKIGSDDNAEFRGATRFLIESTLPDMGTYISTGTLTDVSYTQVTSPTLSSIIETAAESQCVPPPLLLAIMHNEARRTFEYTEEEVGFFSTNSWWDSATTEQKNRGYCYDTCALPGSKCKPTDNVKGAMQFNLNTWKGILPEIKNIVSSKFGAQVTDEEKERCIVRNSIVAAAIKLKKDAQMGDGQCTNWPDDVILRVANTYHGDSCITNAGTNYCENVLKTYKSYSNVVDF
ncbi:MAG: hypothetical protein HYU80_00560 [Candidatus Blackburnbacteria bacterium]|nr:hypothetical protein [Candidatus Blackburnbacteria bacterium]